MRQITANIDNEKMHFRVKLSKFSYLEGKKDSWFKFKANFEAIFEASGI